MGLDGSAAAAGPDELGLGPGVGVDGCRSRQLDLFDG